MQAVRAAVAAPAGQQRRAPFAQTACASRARVCASVRANSAAKA